MSLGERIAAAQREHAPKSGWGTLSSEIGLPYCACGWDGLYEQHPNHVADAVIAALDLGIPCAETGCRMRQITRHHANRLENQ